MKFRIAKPIFAAVFAVAVSSAAGQARAEQRVHIQLAQVANGSAVNITVEALCDKGAPMFRVGNAGTAWPKAGRFAIVRTSDNKVVSKRSMRMKGGQYASFRIPAKRAGNDEYAIKVEPSWYEREGGFDARVSCK